MSSMFSLIAVLGVLFIVQYNIIESHGNFTQITNHLDRRINFLIGSSTNFVSSQAIKGHTTRIMGMPQKGSVHVDSNITIGVRIGFPSALLIAKHSPLMNGSWVKYN